MFLDKVAIITLLFVQCMEEINWVGGVENLLLYSNRNRFRIFLSRNFLDSTVCFKHIMLVYSLW